MKICQFWGRGFISFIGQLYRYNYIVIFGKHLSDLYLILLIFLHPQ